MAASTSQKQGKNIALITGITGQDGSYLAEFLIEKGYEVFIPLTRLSEYEPHCKGFPDQVHGIIRRSSSFNTGRIEHLYADPKSHSGGSMHLHYGDLTDSTCLVKIISQIRPTEIYNLAAQSHVKVSFELAEYTANVDALGTLRLLDAIRTTGMTDQVKFYQASTSEMFGKVQEIPQKETTPFYPRSPYGVAKVYGYWIVINYREAYNIFACNGILFNHESPRRGETFVTRKITRAVAKIVLGQQKVLELGNLDSKRDWGHARDYIELCKTRFSHDAAHILNLMKTVGRPDIAMWLMLQQEKPEDYVISMHESHSVREFVVLAFKKIGIEVEWEGEGVNEVGKNKATGDILVKVNPKFYRPTEVEFLLGDSTKARKELNWKPKYDFDALVGEMVESDLSLMRSHPLA